MSTKDDSFRVPEPPRFDRAIIEEWLQQFPELGAIEDPVWQEVLDSARPVEVPAGTTVFRDGDGCQNYMFVMEGSVKVQKISENGREIVLYRVNAGEACILTTSCLLSHQRYPAEGITETDLRAISIPVTMFDRGIAGSQGFRAFVFSSYGRRIADLIMLVEDVAFGRMDIRLGQYLVDAADDDGQVSRTHQEMAAELGTAREVVSRQLKEFERRNWLKLGRGSIQIADLAALKRHLSTPL
jgi:CRP/FNR family transcriptional regulator, anaerobic regulatory protein